MKVCVGFKYNMKQTGEHYSPSLNPFTFEGECECQHSFISIRVSILLNAQL